MSWKWTCLNDLRITHSALVIDLLKYTCYHGHDVFWNSVQWLCGLALIMGTAHYTIWVCYGYLIWGAKVDKNPDTIFAQNKKESRLAAAKTWVCSLSNWSFAHVLSQIKVLHMSSPKFTCFLSNWSLYMFSLKLTSSLSNWQVLSQIDMFSLKLMF